MLAAWSSTPDITKDRESFTSRRARSLSRRSAVSLSAWTASRTSRSSARTASASDVKLAATRVTGLPRRPSASSCAPPRSRPLSRRPTRLAGALTQSCQLRPCPPHLPWWMRARCPEYPAAPRWERSLRTLEDGARPHTLAAGGVRSGLAIAARESRTPQCESLPPSALRRLALVDLSTPSTCALRWTRPTDVPVEPDARLADAVDVARVAAVLAERHLLMRRH